jgi:hypothetical protein
VKQVNLKKKKTFDSKSYKNKKPRTARTKKTVNSFNNNADYDGNQHTRPLETGYNKIT